jgi:hypothetical protein
MTPERSRWPVLIALGLVPVPLIPRAPHADRGPLLRAGPAGVPRGRIHALGIRPGTGRREGDRANHPDIAENPAHFSYDRWATVESLI